MTGRTVPKIPEGFEKAPARGPFADANGPVWRKPGQDGTSPVFGLMPETRHTNALGFMHGGMIATFSDGAMAQSVYERHRCRLVTLALNISYQHVIPRGRWVEAHVMLGEAIDDRVQAEARLICRKTVCAVATGEFQLFPQK